MSEGVPFLYLNQRAESVVMATISALEVHQRLGHLGKAKLSHIIKSNDAYLVTKDDEITKTDFHCEACHLSNSKRLVSRDPIPRMRRPAMKIHADTQQLTPGPNDERYWCPVVDDASRYTPSLVFKAKDQISPWFIDFKEQIYRSIGNYVMVWRLDGGREFDKFIA